MYKQPPMTHTQNDINTSPNGYSSKSSNEPHHDEPSRAFSATTEMALSWEEKHTHTKAEKVLKGNTETRKRQEKPLPKRK